MLMYLMHHRAGALAHIVNTASQYNLPPITKKLTYAPIVPASPKP